MTKLILIICSFAIFLTACDQSTSKFKEMSDQKLRRERSVCRSIKHPSPGKAIACENVEEEYQRRIKEKRKR